MILATLSLLSVLRGTPDGAAFRFAVAGRAAETVAITAQAPRGWLPAFCTSTICGVGRIPLRLPERGVREVDLRLHHVGDGPRHGSVIVREGRQAIVVYF